MTAYYNEVDPYAAQWLRNLIDAGRIAPGVVDERSIVDVRAGDLEGFAQCHFFAGIGVWSHALRGAGWPDDRPVWTGSCPCQPFSQAGAGKGHADERHLWPTWARLVRQRRPCVVFGEQVASDDGLAWLDVVCTDMEAEGYAIAPFDLCAAGLGAPHIRQRLFFVAHAVVRGQRIERGAQGQPAPRRVAHAHERDTVGQLADPAGAGQREFGWRGLDRQGQARAHPDLHHDGRRLGDASDARPQGQPDRGTARPRGEGPAAERAGAAGDGIVGDAERKPRGAEHEQAQWWWSDARAGHPAVAVGAGATAFWSDAQWIPCRDGKSRPIEPGSFPLAARLPTGMGGLSPTQHRLAGLAGLDGKSLKRAKAYRYGALHGYGNALCAPVAQAFIETYLKVTQ